MGKSKFTKTWGNLTDIGRRFNMSAVALGKFLKENGLKDTNNAPTSKAMEEGFAIATPLKNGRSHFMWHKTKISSLLEEKGVPPASQVEVHVARIHKAILFYLKPNESDKLERIMLDAMPGEFNDMLREVPQAIRLEVRSAVIAKVAPKMGTLEETERFFGSSNH